MNKQNLSRLGARRLKPFRAQKPTFSKKGALKVFIKVYIGFKGKVKVCKINMSRVKLQVVSIYYLRKTFCQT